MVMCISVFGPTVTLSSGRVIPTRWVAEQHVDEDLGYWPPSTSTRPETWQRDW
jgi:hypothetical protein